MARRLMIVAGCIAVLAAFFVRIRYERVGWGAYWSIELEAPWR